MSIIDRSNHITTLTHDEMLRAGRSQIQLDRVGIGQTGSTVDMVEPQGWLALAWLAKRLTIFLIGLVVIFAAIEGALSWLETTNSKPRRFIPKYPTPYVEFYSESMYDSDGITTNEVGFRYGDLPFRKPDGEKRIFMLSSSLGFCGSTNETTISGYMEAMLADTNIASNHRVRVINAAGLSWVTRQSLVLLVTKILDYEPDAIIIFHGPETLYYAVHVDSRLGYPFAFATREARNLKLKNYLKQPNPFLATLSSMRTLQQFQPDLAKTWLQQKLSTLSPHKAMTALEKLEPHIEGVASDIQRMIQIAATYNCRTIVAIPPWHARGLVKEAMPALINRVSQKCQQESLAGAVMVDSSTWERAITDHQVWYPDSIHWTDVGNRIIAGKLIEVMRENNFIE